MHVEGEAMTSKEAKEILKEKEAKTKGKGRECKGRISRQTSCLIVVLKILF